MNSEVQWESTSSRSQLRLKQKVGKVWQALLLASPAFVETLRETLFQPGSFLGSFCTARDNPSLSSGSLHLLARVLASPAWRCAPQDAPIFRPFLPVTVTVLVTVWQLPWLHHIRVKRRTNHPLSFFLVVKSQVLLLPRLRTCFPFSSIPFDLLLSWSFLCFFRRCVWHLQFFLIWGSHWFHLPIFFLVFPELCKFCLSCWVQGSIQQLLQSIVLPVTMRISSPISISSFCVLWPSIGFLLFSSVSWVICVSPHVFNAVSFMKERCRCLDRGLCLSCSHHQFHLQSFHCVLFLLLHLSHVPVYQLLPSLYFHFYPVSFSCMLFPFVWCGGHFALRRLNHCFVFFWECPCSWGVVHRWGDHHVE